MHLSRSSQLEPAHLRSSSSAVREKLAWKRAQLSCEANQSHSKNSGASASHCSSAASLGSSRATLSCQHWAGRASKFAGQAAASMQLLWYSSEAALVRAKKDVLLRQQLSRQLEGAPA